MLTIRQTRFGDLEVDEKRLLNFPEGLLGFPDQHDYVLLEHKPGSPFYWLQSVDAPDLAFVMIDALLVKEDFLEALAPSEREGFKGIEAGHKVVFALVTIPPGEVEKMTVNLLGPLLIDVQKRIGKQVVLPNSGYSPRFPITEK
jgi:flagellar assembly factor FliW